MLNMDWKCNKAELEAWVEMSRDWDAKEIDLDEDGRIWVLITPKMLEEEAREYAEVKLTMVKAGKELLSPRRENSQVMTMYRATKCLRRVVQASTPIHQVIGTPIMGPKVTV